MRVIFATLFLIFLFSCSSEHEQHQIVYEFKLVNDTDSDYVVKKHFRESRTVFKADTLFKGSEMVLVVPRVGSYGESFGDSLIQSFFDTLSVTLINTNRAFYLGERSNWKESSEFDDDFLEKPGAMKGKVIYTLKMGKLVDQTSSK